jgi:hypothetical protein
MLVRALTLGSVLSCFLWLVAVAPGCTNGTTPICTPDSGCGPDIDDSSTDALGEVAPDSPEQ